MKNRSNGLHLRTCVSPDGQFVYGMHQPHFHVANLRDEDFIAALGKDNNGKTILNRINFPQEDVEENSAGAIFEVPNPFPFRGTTYIGKGWADRSAADPGRISIQPPPTVSLHKALQKVAGNDAGVTQEIFANLPEPLQIALATTSTDPQDLIKLAITSCQLLFDKTTGQPLGLAYETDASGRTVPKINSHTMFEAVANNPYLPAIYKEVMVLRPGVQGDSEIVGQWHKGSSHVFEYLRRNSYIPWGHYAANMAHDAVRYTVGDLTPDDILGMRHLYYQRTYSRLAADLKITPLPSTKTLSADNLEVLRHTLLKAIQQHSPLPFSATLWGWNFGFDYAPSGYRLHASHQQIHQQFALIPENVPEVGEVKNRSILAFACGDMIHTFIQEYRQQTNADFFTCYEKAIHNNQRMDDRKDGPDSLVVHADDQVMLFVPKAQTSQWELQLMPRLTVGNILETDGDMRKALDRALLIAMRVLTAMGATMVTVIEYSKRFGHTQSDQRLLYAFLPRLPESPGAFSEAQLRWINGHYPEDFAHACRQRLDNAIKDLV